MNPPTTDTLCIYGATGAGIAAAVQAARMGRHVILIEPTADIGGIMTQGLGSSDVNNHASFRNEAALGGIARQFYAAVGQAYGREGPVYGYEPHVGEAIFRRWLDHPAITLVAGTGLREPIPQAAEKQGTRLQALHLADGRRIAASCFIDASIEGDLLAAAGVRTVVGREANALHGETLNGIRGENTYRQFEVRVDPWNRPGDPSSGVLPTIQDEPLGEPGAGDHRIQAYCFRLCLTDDPANRIPFARPDGYDPAQYEIYRRYAAAGGRLWTPQARLPGRKTDLGSWHDLSANLYGMNHAYPEGSTGTRQRILAEHLAFTQGLCWFLAHDPALPSELRAEWSRWGTCRDEFTTSGGWPRQFYVRDARRMVSPHVITEHHLRVGSGVEDGDPVAVAYWPPDVHHVRRIVRDGAAYNEGFVFGGSIAWRPFGISYRALVPHPQECTNLLTPTCPSSTHVAYGAIRLEWTFMALGQACATAAVLALEHKTSVQEVDYGGLQTALLQAKGQLNVPAST